MVVLIREMGGAEIRGTMWKGEGKGKETKGTSLGF